MKSRGTRLVVVMTATVILLLSLVFWTLGTEANLATQGTPIPSMCDKTFDPEIDSEPGTPTGTDRRAYGAWADEFDGQNPNLRDRVSIVCLEAGAKINGATYSFYQAILTISSGTLTVDVIDNAGGSVVSVENGVTTTLQPADPPVALKRGSILVIRGTVDINFSVPSGGSGVQLLTAVIELLPTDPGCTGAPCFLP